MLLSVCRGRELTSFSFRSFPLQGFEMESDPELTSWVVGLARFLLAPPPSAGTQDTMLIFLEVLGSELWSSHLCSK